MMGGKRPRPIIGKLSELLVAGDNYRGVSDVMTSPKSPLDFRIQSPRVMKNYDVGGVGLKIVASLENSGDSYSRLAVRRSNLSRFCGTGAVVNDSGKRFGRFRGGCGDWEMESSDNYTYVTYHGPEKSVTKVFSDGCEQRRSNNPGPAKAPAKWFVEDVATYPTSDFLSSCHSCRKNLHGKDIYMYRGEKGFCSPECRLRQMMMDEGNEQQCRSEASKSTEVSIPAHNAGQIFATGILVI